MKLYEAFIAIPDVGKSQGKKSSNNSSKEKEDRSYFMNLFQNKFKIIHSQALIAYECIKRLQVDYISKLASNEEIRRVNDSSISKADYISLSEEKSKQYRLMIKARLFAEYKSTFDQEKWSKDRRHRFLEEQYQECNSRYESIVKSSSVQRMYDEIQSLNTIYQDATSQRIIPSAN